MAKNTLNMALKDIGNVLKLREDIDPDLRVTKHIRSNLATVDIIPVDYNLRLDSINIKADKMAVAYDFLTPMQVFQDLCSHYDLDDGFGGIRLWLTDETQAYEDFSHSFDNNIIEDAVNTLSGMGKQMRQILRSTGNSNVLNSILDQGPEIVGNAARSAGNFASGLLPGSGNTNTRLGQDTGGSASLAQQLTDIVAGTAKTAASVVLQGKQVSLPKIWQTSEYKPTFTMNLKLVAPYGSKTAIKHYIVEPLLYLLLLASPRTNDGLSYGLHQPVRLKGYGMSNVNLGAIDNIQIRRGGRETAYNVWKQPLIVEVAVSVMPLSDGFAVMEPNGPKDIATFNDADRVYDENITETPAITTLGNVIQSLRPAPDDVVNQDNAVSNLGVSDSFSPEASIGSEGNTRTPTRASESTITTSEASNIMNT